MSGLGFLPWTLAAMGGGGGGGGGGEGTPPEFTSIADQEIVTVSVAKSLTVSAPDDTAVSFYDDAVLLGAGTDNLDGTFTYSWTPGSVDYGIDLHAVGNVSGDSDHLTIVVAEANAILQTMTSWTKSPAGSAITGGHPDPDGGNNAYYFNPSTALNALQRINRSPSPLPTEFNCGFEIWAKPNGHDVLLFNPTGDSTAHSAYVDLVTGQTQTTRAYCKIVERRVDGWVRVWFAYNNATTAGISAMFLQICKDLGDSTPDSTAGEGMYFFEPRMADGVLPFTTYQQMTVNRSAVAGNLETWLYKHPYVNSVADQAAGSLTIDVIKPTGWSSAGSYPVLFTLPALTKAAEDVSPIIDAAGFADTYGVVVVIPYFKTGIPWYGQKSDGSSDEHAFTAEILPSFATEFLAGSASRSQRLLLGYSKSGWGAFSLMLRNPTVFGYASAWDVPWVINYATESTSLGLDTMFGTEAQFNLYDPYQILAANVASVNDTTRLSVRGFETWGADFAPMTTLLTSNSVTFTQESIDRGAHSYSSGWLPTAVADLMTMAGIP